MRSPTFKAVFFSNKKKQIEVVYTSGKKITIHFGSIGIRDSIRRVWVDSETRGKSIGIELANGEIDFMPYDQPLAIAKDPEYLLQEHIEQVIALIKNALKEQKISKRYLAQQLETSDNQIQRLLNPDILNKNLSQLYKIASILGLEFEMELKKAA
ncbi:MAG: hypothetical protein A3F16_06160 [Deltaproteobacteria bacterium RIFCSPHIGHO2_12_FULL_43_9]|nr:MAG: hypothetical protein A3F16_06160 [Deltaproteobacteria bacterium RIFCSPHIGHO2_12_FULL_43_9]